MKIRKEVKKLSYPSVAATTAMTLFSYVVSYLFNTQFKEPKLLSYFFFTPGRKKSNTPPLGGYVLHYLVGAGFTIAYKFIWKKWFKLPTWRSGLAYGSVCSVAGMLSWKAVFATHSSPPDIKLKSYLFHLFLAHLVFGVVLSKTDESNLHFKQAS